jgi:hypothetical protein
LIQVFVGNKVKSKETGEKRLKRNYEDTLVEGDSRHNQHAVPPRRPPNSDSDDDKSDHSEAEDVIQVKEVENRT